ncbi:MAG: hypothetical protein R2845_16215 [Thermomicrobiales bacterium]
MDDPGNGAAPRLVVANRYVVDLDAMIGSGGMALVYRGSISVPAGRSR